MKIKSNTTNKDLPWRFGLYQRPSSEENGTNSSSGSCHGSGSGSHITTVARTGRISSIFFWRKPLIETETSR